MTIVHDVKNFLEKQLQLQKMGGKDFANASNITYKTVRCILNCKGNNTKFETIIKIASYFNRSIDEILNRKGYIYNKKYCNVNDVLENYNMYLRNFLCTSIAKQNLNPYILSEALGFSETVIQQFITDTSQTRTLSTPVIITVADYFQISIDEMINRVIGIE